MVFGSLHWAFQPQTPPFRPPLLRSLQDVDCGWQWNGILENGVRLCPSQSRASGVDDGRASLGELSLEQLWLVFASAEKQAGDSLRRRWKHAVWVNERKNLSPSGGVGFWVTNNFARNSWPR